MTQDAQHHEDVAAVTIHFHEDEVLALAQLLSPAPDHGRITLPEVKQANAAIRRVTSTANDVMHAHRAARHERKR